MPPIPELPTTCPNGFRTGTGLNISHWLSQRPADTPPASDYFTESDVQFLRSCGFEHLRLPVDEPILWEEDGSKRDTEWTKLFAALEWCHRHDLRAVVDLHIIQSHHFNAGNQGKENPLWTSQDEQDHLIALWEELSDALRDQPADRVAYEIMNEPVAPDPEMWNDLLARTHATIRSREPERTVVIGSNLWQKTRTIPYLRLPENDPNIVLSFHYYEPGMVTHYRTRWTALKDYDGPVQYPGVPYPEEALQGDVPSRMQELLDKENRHYDREVIREDIAVAVDYASKLGIPAYCGEWGCYPSIEEPMRHHWYRDVRAVLDAFGIGWAIWDYKGGFHIVDPDTREADHALIDLLTK